MKVQDILKAKGRRVVTVTPGATIHSLVRLMRLERVGAVVVSKDGISLDGIVSERDVVVGLGEYGERLLDRQVSDLMTQSVRTCAPGDNIKDIMRTMTTNRVRHIPVVDDGRLAGIVSIGDVVKNRLDDMELEANVLRDVALAHR